MNKLNRNRLIDAESKLVVATRDNSDHCMIGFRENDKGKKIQVQNSNLK